MDCWGTRALRAGYDFMLLRAQTGEIDASLGDWWTRFIESDGAAQEALIAGAPKDHAPAKKRRRRSPNRRRGPNTDGGHTPADTQGE